MAVKKKVSVKGGAPVPITCVVSQAAADDAENPFSGAWLAAVCTSDGHRAVPAPPPPSLDFTPAAPSASPPSVDLASWTSVTGCFEVPIHTSCLHLNILTILLEREKHFLATLTLCTTLFLTVTGPDRKERGLSLLFVLFSAIYFLKACSRQYQPPRHAVRTAGDDPDPSRPCGRLCRPAHCAHRFGWAVNRPVG